MKVEQVFSDRKRFLDLLLLADEQEDMIDRYLERGDMFALYDEDKLRAVNYFYVAGIAVLNSLWIAALYLLVNVLTNLEEYKGLWKELCRWLKMRSMR